MRSRIRYDERSTLELPGRIKASFGPELIRAKAGQGEPSKAPIFIVGVHRSGTSLVEQIIASHPKAFGGGEVGSLGSGPIGGRGVPLRYPEDVAGLGPEALREFGSEVLRRLTSLGPGSPKRITDKMPTNFWFLGLIHLALPNARIIHVRRDPTDTCVSCFSKLFGDSPPLYTYDLAELGRYYRAYDDVMRHWREALPPGVMLEVQYEELVANLETEARRMIAHCGLEWNPACLSYHRTKRVLNTASVVQVRQPIFQSSIGRWRLYGEFLGPLFEALGPGLSPAEAANSKTNAIASGDANASNAGSRPVRAL
jgi:hypothetical protein